MEIKRWEFALSENSLERKASDFVFRVAIDFAIESRAKQNRATLSPVLSLLWNKPIGSNRATISPRQYTNHFDSSQMPSKQIRYKITQQIIRFARALCDDSAYEDQRFFMPYNIQYSGNAVLSAIDFGPARISTNCSLLRNNQRIVRQLSIAYNALTNGSAL